MNPTSSISPSDALGALQGMDGQSEQNQLAVAEEQHRHQDAMAAIHAASQG